MNSAQTTTFNFFLILLIQFLPHAISATTNGLDDTDRLSLLAIKSKIFQDPQLVTSSWNNLFHYCKWQGVTCGHRHKRVTVLDLSSRGLMGSLSPHIGNLSFLREIRLEHNALGGGIPPEVGRLFRLQKLRLHNNSFEGEIPANISKCTNLISLRLGKNNLIGTIPKEFTSLFMLKALSISYNNLSGEFPPFIGNLTSLEYLYVVHCRLRGSIPNVFHKLRNLSVIVLDENHFIGTIPSSLYNLSLLEALSLKSNRLKGSLPRNLAFMLPNLQELYLSDNQFTGFLPPSLSNFSELYLLDLGINNFYGKVGIDFGNLQNLKWLSLGANNLGSGEQDEMKCIDSLSNCSYLQHLDIMRNRFRGMLPNSLGNFSVQLEYLDLSENSLYMDQLSGEIPLPLPSAIYVDFSNNMLSGTIPDSICQATKLEVLDLSYNRLSSRIPSCLIEMNLDVLNLGNNNLSGNIPEIFPRDCSLHTLDLHGNFLEGEVPKSLARCSMLEVLNLGKNLINDTFPCFLKGCTNLRVLSLRSNMLHGDILCIEATKVWPNLQIIDLASNYFTGHVARNFFNWRAMKGDHPKVQVLISYYNLETVTVMNKGIEMELVKILTIFTAIDISNNRFTGEISGSIGDLSALYVLNMSHNAFTGSIPTSIGMLRQLGSLDLSLNNLAGMIPTELTNLTFLSYLNLSCNLLEGRIPTGSQFLTFTETSFGGNKGLCGFQLNISCSPDEPPPPSEEADQKGESIVDVVGVEVGFVVGLATFIAPLVFSKRWSRWYYKHAERIIVTKVYWYYERRNRERRIPIRRLE